MLSGNSTDKRLEVVVLVLAAVLALLMLAVVSVQGLLLVLVLVLMLVMVSVLASDIAHFFAYQGIGILCGLPGHNRNRW